MSAIVVNSASTAELRGSAETACLRGGDVRAALLGNLRGCGDAGVVGGDGEGAFDDVGRGLSATEGDGVLGGGHGGFPAEGAMGRGQLEVR